jgi:hypothetical protein
MSGLIGLAVGTAAMVAPPLIAANNSGGGGGGSGEGDLTDPKSILNYIFSLMSAEEQKKALAQYNADVDQQTADAYRTAGKIGPEGLATYDASSQQGLGELFGLRGRQGQGYYDRYAAAEQDLRGYGEQQKADIDTAFAKQQGAWNLNPLSRGSTVGGTVSGNIDKNRLAEQRRLGEDLARMRINTLSGLSGEALSADERGTDNIANWFGTDATNRAGLTTQGYRDFLNTIESINRVPPPQNTLPFQFGGNSGGVAQPPGYGGYALGAMAPGVGNAVGAGVNQWMQPPQANYNYNPTPDDYADWISPPVNPNPQYGPGGMGPPAW